MSDIDNRKPFAYVTKQGKLVRTGILEQYALKSDAGSREIEDDFKADYNKGLIEPLYEPLSLAKLLEMNTYHMRACKTKARDSAGLGWELDALKEDPSQDQYDRIKTFFQDMPENLSKVLNKVMFDYEATGYGTIEIVKTNYASDGEIAFLKHIPSHTMRMHKSKKKAYHKRGTKGVWFKIAGVEEDLNANTGIFGEAGSIPESKRASEIFWINNYTPRSDYYGMPDIIPALGAIHGDISRRDYNIAFFDNYGVPAYAVFITGNFELGEEDADGKSVFERNIESHFSQVSKNPHSTLVLSVPTRGRGDGEVEVKFHPLSTETKEASFRLYRQDNRDEVLAAHGVPPYRMGISETGSLGGSTAKETTEIYKNSILEPRQEMLEEFINKYILREGFEITDWDFSLAPIDSSDEQRDVELITKLMDYAAVTPNELIRFFAERFSLTTVDHPAMDAHYLKGYPLDMEMKTVPEVEGALQSLQEKLIKVALKNDESTENGNDYRGYSKILAGIEELTLKTKQD